MIFRVNSRDVDDHTLSSLLQSSFKDSRYFQFQLILQCFVGIYTNLFKLDCIFLHAMGFKERLKLRWRLARVLLFLFSDQSVEVKLRFCSVINNMATLDCITDFTD